MQAKVNKASMKKEPMSVAKKTRAVETIKRRITKGTVALRLASAVLAKRMHPHYLETVRLTN